MAGASPFWWDDEGAFAPKDGSGAASAPPPPVDLGGNASATSPGAGFDFDAIKPVEPSSLQKDPGLPSKILSGVESVLGAPKHLVDAAARRVARMEGMDVPDDMTTGQMLRTAAGYDPAESKSIKDRVIGRVIEFGGDMASDPLTAAMMGAGSVVGSGAEAAGTIAKGAGAAFMGMQGIGAAQEGAEAYRAAKEKGIASPEFAEAATGAGLSAAGLALPLAAHVFGHEAPAEEARPAAPGEWQGPEQWRPPTPQAPNLEGQPFELPTESSYEQWPFPPPEGTQPSRPPGEGFASPEEQAFTGAVEQAASAPPGPPRLAPPPEEPYSLSPEGKASGVSDEVAEAFHRAYQGAQEQPPRLAPAQPAEAPPEAQEAPDEFDHPGMASLARDWAQNRPQVSPAPPAEAPQKPGDTTWQMSPIVPEGGVVPAASPTPPPAPEVPPEAGPARPRGVPAPSPGVESFLAQAHEPEVGDKPSQASPPDIQASDDVQIRSTGEKGFAVHDPENGVVTVRVNGGGQKVVPVTDLVPDTTTARGQLEAATRRPPAPEGTVADAGSQMDAIQKRFNFADSARARIAARASGATAGGEAVPGLSIAANLGDLAIVGAEHIANGAYDFASFSKRMLDQYGSKVKQFLPDLYNKAIAHLSGTEPTEDAEEFERTKRPEDLSGAPPQVLSRLDESGLKARIAAMAKEGVSGRYWYEDSGKKIMEITGGNLDDARLLTKLIGIWSPQEAVTPNWNDAVRAYYQIKRGETVQVSGLGWKNEASNNVAKGIDWSGNKTNNFYKNLMRQIDPMGEGHPEKQGTTIDMHIMRALGYPKDAPGDAQYRYADRVFQDVAKEMGWEPQQVQAAVWTSQKWRNEVLAKAQAKGVEPAPVSAFSFADSANRAPAQVSSESTPHATTGFLPGMASAPYELRRQHMLDANKAFLDENGRDEIAGALGLLKGKGFEGPGRYQDELNPSFHEQFQLPTKGPEGQHALTPGATDLLERYAAAKGDLLKQQAVAYHKPFWDTTLKNANGADARMGATITPEQMATLNDAIKKAVPSGVSPDDLAVVPTPQGFRVLNFSDIPNQKFQTLVESVAGEINHDTPIQIGSFHSEGNLVSNDWERSPNGEDYQARYAAPGGPDLSGAMDRVRARLQGVNDRYARDYGWDKAPEPPDVPGPGAEAGAEEGVASGPTGPTHTYLTSDPQAILQSLSDRAQRMGQRAGSTDFTEVPGAALDLLHLGASILERGAYKGADAFESWSHDMLEAAGQKFGDISDRLRDLWDQAHQVLANRGTPMREETDDFGEAPKKQPELPFNLNRMNLTPENKAALEASWRATPDIYQNAKGGVQGKMTWDDFKQSGLELAGIVDRKTFEKAIKDGAPISDPASVVLAKTIQDQHSRAFMDAVDQMSKANESGMGVEAAQRNFLKTSIEKINYELSLKGARAQAARTLNSWKILVDADPKTPINQLLEALVNESC